jgi:hypothetical protein
MPIDADPITATIPEFRRLSGIGRSRIYELLDAGELDSVHIGARRLILIDSYRQLLARLQAAKGDAPRRRDRAGEGLAPAG